MDNDNKNDSPLIVVPCGAVPVGLLFFAFAPGAPLFLIASASTLASLAGWILAKSRGW